MEEIKFELLAIRKEIAAMRTHLDALLLTLVKHFAEGEHDIITEEATELEEFLNDARANTLTED